MACNCGGSGVVGMSTMMAPIMGVDPRMVYFAIASNDDDTCVVHEDDGECMEFTTSYEATNAIEKRHLTGIARAFLIG